MIYLRNTDGAAEVKNRVTGWYERLEKDADWALDIADADFSSLRIVNMPPSTVRLHADRQLAMRTGNMSASPGV